MDPNPYPFDDLTASKVTNALDDALRHADANYLNSKKISKQELITTSIMTELHNCGKNLGYNVPYISDNAKVGWLYDMIWKGGPKDDPPLVVECNMGTDFRDIRNDFEKMLMARAELRLLITDGGDNQKDNEKAFENLERLKSLIPYNESSSPDHYLFAIIISDKNGGHVFRYDFV